MRGRAEEPGRAPRLPLRFGAVRTFLFLTIVLLALPSSAGPKKKLATPAKAVAASAVEKADPAGTARAFEKLKSLAGRWTATRDGKTSEAFFDVVAGQTAVMERSGFLTVYYVEDGALVGIVFTDEGNQAHLRSARGLEDGGDAIAFDVSGTSNVRPGAGHVTGVTIRIIDPDHLVQTYHWREGAKDSSFEIVLTRNSASTLK